VFLSSRHEAAHEVSSPLQSQKPETKRSAGSVLRWWRAPLWVLALGTGAKSFADNPILGSEALNRRGLHVRRLTLAHRLAWARRARLARSVPAEWREQFDRDGFIETREQQQGETITRRVAIGPELLRTVPELNALIEGTRWRSLLAYVASTSSRPLYYVQTILAHHVDGPPDPQLELHSDTFHPSLKAWLFLTDVGEEDGPLTYVPGSHRLTTERLAWEQERSISIHQRDRLSQRGSLRVSAEELPALGLPAPRRFAVPANTLVVVDTYGFHARGASTGPSVRAEIWAYVRRTPFLPWTGLDILSLKPLAIRRADWLYRMLDTLDRLGIRKQHWRPGGRKRPLDR
jgi:hypothetical protein